MSSAGGLTSRICPGRAPRCSTGVNGELAGLLTDRPGSEPILLDLEDANTFVESLDPGRGWFRCHRLLADFLRLELRRTLPAEVPVLHRRQWPSR